MRHSLVRHPALGLVTRRLALASSASLLLGGALGGAAAAAPATAHTLATRVVAPSAASAPVLGSMVMALTAANGGTTVSTSFTLTASVVSRFAKIQVAVRPASDPSSTNGRLGFGLIRNLTFAGTRTFQMSTAALAPGSYVARPAYLMNGRWVDGDLPVNFTVSSDAPAPAPAPAPVPAPVPAPAPVPVPVPVPAPAAATVGSAAGFSPGGGFPFLSDRDLARDLDGINAAGATWVRVDFPWSTMEPVQGAYQWANLDRVTTAAAARGIKVLALPAYSPAWARPGCGTDKCPPANPDDFARFVADAGRHFGPDRVQAWELWNEPNIASFWAPKPNTEAYAVLLAKAAAALRAARPEAYIVSAGLSPAYSDGTNVAPVDFVKRLYTLGALRDVDAVGIHPYSDRTLPLATGTESWNTFLQMQTVHDVMVANGDGAKQVWGTEFGVATGTSANSTTETQQAAIIKQGYGRLADGTWPWFGKLFTYSLRDSANNISDWQSNYGLTRYDTSPKPSYGTFTDAMRQGLSR